MGFLKKLRVANQLRDKDWDPEGKISLSYRGNELAGEVGELCNKLKKLHREYLGLKGSHVTIREIEEEIGDAFITLDLAAMALGIDMEEAATRQFNKKSREHGFPQYLEDDEHSLAREEMDKHQRRWEVEKEVKGIISEQIGCPLEVVNDNDTLGALGADSIDSVEISIAIEEKILQVGHPLMDVLEDVNDETPVKDIVKATITLLEEREQKSHRV